MTNLNQVKAAAEELIGLPKGVVFDLEVEGLEADLGVGQVSLDEGLNQLPTGTIHAFCDDDSLRVADLLGKPCRLGIERENHVRAFRGIVRHASIHEARDGLDVQLQVVPAAWLLTCTLDSRVYQNMTAVEIIKEVVQEKLGGDRCTVSDDNLTGTYPTHEYVVQYQESYFNFLARLLEREGIFFYVDYEAEVETLVLVDSTSGLSEARPNADQPGIAPYAKDPGRAPDGEAISDIVHDQQVGSNRVVVADYDWTDPESEVSAETEVADAPAGESDGLPALEVYDHTDAVSFHDYQGTRYGAHTATAQATTRGELLGLAQQSWTLESTVVSAEVGRTISVGDYPDSALEGPYLIVSATSHGAATAGGNGSWNNTLHCVPTAIPFRPARSTPKPVIPGPESATVVGPQGEEVHTDEHGRIKVQFHWDRLGGHDDHSSCYVRVTQGWAGAGFGSFLIPRIGMEVIVSFLGGNPDRPVVTGCVYNGDNQPPYPLPDEKTKSVLKTRSSVGGGGANELRIEDASGSEEIYVHAQKDYNEAVENNHSTTVGADQTNAVTGSQTETIETDQSLTVQGARTKTVHQAENISVMASRSAQITQNNSLSVGGNYSRSVSGNSSVNTDMASSESVQLAKALTVGAYQVTVNSVMNETVVGLKAQEVGAKTVNVGTSLSEDVGTSHQCQVGKSSVLDAGDSITLKTGDSSLTMKKDGTVVLRMKQFTLKTKSGSMVLKDNGDIAFDVKKTTVNGSKIQIKGSSNVVIKGSKVNIN